MLAHLKHTLQLAGAHVTRPLTGLTPIHTHQPGDIFVAGFPKSGNTWSQYLIAGALCGVDAARCPDALVQDLVPDVHDHVSYRRYTRPVFFKTHSLPDPGYRRVIHLVRDGRDAMVSYFHHYNALFSPVDFATFARDITKLGPAWHTHTEAWLANPHGAEVLVVKYEDLKRQTAAELRRICAFAGLTIDDPQIAQAVEGASFTNMKRREQQLGWENQTWPKDKAFVRRGVVGSFRDEMPPDVLALFLQEAGPTLRKFGYLE